MAFQDPESLARHHRVRRLCRELTYLLQTSVEQRHAIDELLTKLAALTRGTTPLARAAGRSTDPPSPG